MAFNFHDYYVLQFLPLSQSGASTRGGPAARIVNAIINKNSRVGSDVTRMEVSSLMDAIHHHSFVTMPHNALQILDRIEIGRRTTAR